MIIWALVFGMSLTLDSGKLDMAAQVEAVFQREAECQAVKAKLDAGSAQAVQKGEVHPNVNSFGAVCVPVNLTIHNKKVFKGA
jgi:hypothetical protein